ncbi:MAG: ABC transporter substrate-binding protein [Leptospirales bacterium]
MKRPHRKIAGESPILRNAQALSWLLRPTIALSLLLSQGAFPSSTRASSLIPALQMPNVPVIQQSAQQPRLEVSDASLQIAYEQGMEKLNHGEAKEALQAFQNILLDYPAEKLPLEVYLALARTYRTLKAPDKAIVTLLPLLKAQVLAQASTKSKQEFMYELGIADAILHNDTGTRQFLIPVFPLLEKPSAIWNAARALTPYFQKTDPLEGVVLLGQSIDKLDPVTQKKMLSLTIELIHDHISQLPDLQSIEKTFPHEFPGDYALFRIGLIQNGQNQPDKAERTFLTLLSDYPSSLFTSAVQERMNHLLFPKGQAEVAVILPPLSDPVRGSFARSILSGIVLFLNHPKPGSSLSTLPLVVHFSKNASGYQETLRSMVARFNLLALVGPFFSEDLEKVKSILERRGIPAITPTLPPRKAMTTLYSTATLPEMMASAAALETPKRVTNPEAVILYPSQPYGRVAARTYGLVLESQGGKVMGSFPYRSDKPDHQTALDTLRKKGVFINITPDTLLPEGMSRVSADVMSVKGKTFFLNSRIANGKRIRSLFLPSFNTVFIPDTSLHPSAILRELAYKNIQNVSVFGNETFLTTKGLSGIEDLHDTIYATGTPSGTVFSSGRPSQRQPAGLFILQTYDALSLIEELVDQGATDSNSLLALLKSHPSFEGASGTITWDGPGRYRKSVGIYQLTRNRWVPSDTVEVTYPIETTK